MNFTSPAGFDRALKRAIRQAGGDPGKEYRQALRDRFLCRVFSDPENRYILKGGSGMLARIPDARSTRDLDFAAIPRVPSDMALHEMERLASRDLGDFCRFSLTKHEETMDENGYSRLLKLRFATYVGDQEKDPILIDLSLDCSPTLPPEQIEPLNRISLEGIVTCEYLLYSLPDQLADKLCAVMELQANGFPSSRMKDLVDIVFYATSEKVDLKQLSVAIKAECQKRNMEEPTAFSAPDEWRVRFPTFAARTKIRDEFRDFDAASNLATRFFSPALEDRIEYMCWNPDKLEWIASDGKSALH